MKTNLKSNTLSLNEAIDVALETDVYIWRYALLVVHARKEEEESNNIIFSSVR